MPLPESRDFDAVDSGPLPAATVNNLQDSIANGRHGDVELMIPGSAGQSPATGGAIFTGSFAGAAFGEWYHTGGGSADVDFPFAIPVGSKIKEVTVYGGSGNVAGETYSGAIHEHDLLAPGSGVQKSTTKTTGTSGGPENLNWIEGTDTDFPITTLDNKAYSIGLRLNSGSIADEVVVRAVKIRYSKPT